MKLLITYFLLSIILVQENQSLQSRIAEMAVQGDIQSFGEGLFDWDTGRRDSLYEEFQTAIKANATFVSETEVAEKMENLDATPEQESEDSTGLAEEADEDTGEVLPANESEDVSLKEPLESTRKSDCSLIQLRRKQTDETERVSAAVKRKNRRKNRISSRRLSLMKDEIFNLYEKKVETPTLSKSIRTSHQPTKASQNFRKLKDLDSTYAEVLRLGFNYNRCFPPLNRT